MGLREILKVAQFVGCYTACFLVPIQVCVALENHSLHMGSIEKVQIALDVLFLEQVYSKLYNNRYISLAIILISPSVSLTSVLSGAMGGSLLVGIKWVYLLRLIKCLLLPELFRKARKVMDCLIMGVTDTVVRIVLIFLIFSFGTSATASLWFALSCSFVHGNIAECINDNSWVAADSIIGNMDLSSTSSKYFRSLHFVMQTLATIGYGDIHPVNETETLLALCLLLSGAIFYGYVISCITSLLSSQDITAKMFRNDSRRINEYLKIRKVDECLRDQFATYYEFLFSRQMGLTEQAVLSSLPDQVALEVKAECCLSMLLTVPFFKNKRNARQFAQNCIHHMTFITYSPGAVVCEEGSSERNMYLIRSGKLDLMSPLTRKPVVSLITGDCVGDYQMIFGGHTDMEVISSVYTEVACLSFASLSAVLNEEYDAEDTNEIHPPVSHNIHPLPHTARVRRRASLSANKSERRCTSLIRLQEELRLLNAVVTSPGSPMPEKTPMPVKDIHTEAKVAQSSFISELRGSHVCVHRESLNGTLQAHRALHTRMEKTMHSMEATTKTKKLAEMMQLDTVAVHTLTIHPSHPFCFAWNIVVIATILYFNLAVPLRIMTQYNCAHSMKTPSECLSEWNWTILIDYTGDVIMLVHFILQARFFAFLRYNGDKMTVEADALEIWNKFRSSSYYWVLIFLLLPVDALSIFCGYLLCLRIVKLLSLMLLSEAVISAQLWLEHQRGLVISAEALTVALLAIHTLLVTVWMTVGWYILQYNGAQSSNWISALYWCLTTLTTTGYGDITPVNTQQTIYNIGASIVGPTIFATIIAKFSSYVKQEDASSSNVEHRLSTVAQFVRTLCVSNSNDDGEGPSNLHPQKPNCQCSSTPASATAGRESVSSLFPAAAPAAGSSTKTGAGVASGWFEDSRKHPAPRLRRSLSGIGSSTLNLLREVAMQSSGAITSVASTVSQSVKRRVIATTRRMYRPAADLKTKEGIQYAVAEYFHYLSRGGQSFLEELVLPKQHTPLHIKNNLRNAVLECTIAALPIFSKCDKTFQRSIAAAMVQKLVPRRTTLIDAAIADGLYLIKTGSVSVVDVALDRADNKSAGQYFGADSLTEKMQRNTEIKVYTRTDCELWFLSTAVFSRILLAHPKKQDFLQHIWAAQQTARLTLPRQASTNTSISLSMARPILKHLRRGNEAIRVGDIAALSNIKRKPVASEDAFVLRPDSSVMLAWMLLLCAFTLYNFIILPIRVAYFQGHNVTTWYCIDYMGDAVYLIDIILRFQCLAYFERDEPVMDRNKIRRHYIAGTKKYFDICSIIPIDVVLLSGSFRSFSAAQTLSILRLNRLLRLRDVNEGVAILEVSINKFMSAKSQNKKNVIRLLKLIATIFLIAHAFGCVFFFIASQEQLHGNSENWANIAGLFSSRSAATSTYSADEILMQYMSSVYWATALLTTVGYGDISPVSDGEKMYNIFLFIVGTLVYATVIVHLQDIVSQLDVTSDLFKNRMSVMESFLLRECASAEYSAKARAYMDKLWATQRGALGTEIKEFMPRQLYAAALSNTAASHQLSKLFFVGQCDSAFQQEFLSQLEVVHYLKDDVVFRTGEAAQKIYFISQGDLSLVSIDLQTDTVTAIDATLPSRHRNSLLGNLGGTGVGTGGARRSSLQESPFKSASPAVEFTSTKPSSGNGSSSSATQNGNGRFSFSSIAMRSSILLNTLRRSSIYAQTKIYTGASAGVRGRRGSSSGAMEKDGGRRKGRRTSYLKVQDGFVGEMEFFTRSCYACSAKANSETILLEMSFKTFISLVERFELKKKYAKQLRSEEIGLNKNSTFAVVQRLDNNMANKKMAKMMSVCITEVQQLHCVLPDSWQAVSWNILLVISAGLLAINIPLFSAFPESQLTLPIVLDILAFVVFGFEIYFSMYRWAVVVDGTLITDETAIYQQYASTHMLSDASATIPLPLIVILSSWNRDVYGWLRWINFLRLHKVSGCVYSLLRQLGVAMERPMRDSEIRVISAILAILYLGHLAGCLFCVIGRQELLRGTESWIDSNALEASSNSSIYLRSYYWALYTLTTVGYGSVSLPSITERVFAMGVMVLGSILNAMLSALLSSLVESSDKTSGLARRAADAANRFCTSNQIDQKLRDKVSDYYKYRTEVLGNSEDQEGFSVLSEALRVELVCRTGWRSMRKLNCLDPALFDKSTQHGFILSIARIVTTYLAIPGEVLASVSLIQLHESYEELSASANTNTGSGSSGESAAISSSDIRTQSNKSNKQQKRQNKTLQRSQQQNRLYAGVDFMLVRRGTVTAAALSAETGSSGAKSCSAAPAYSKNCTVFPGQVVNLFAISAQLDILSIDDINQFRSSSINTAGSTAQTQALAKQQLDSSEYQIKQLTVSFTSPPLLSDESKLTVVMTSYSQSKHTLHALPDGKTFKCKARNNIVLKVSADTAHRIALYSDNRNIGYISGMNNLNTSSTTDRTARSHVELTHFSEESSSSSNYSGCSGDSGYPGDAGDAGGMKTDCEDINDMEEGFTNNYSEPATRRPGYSTINKNNNNNNAIILPPLQCISEENTVVSQVSHGSHLEFSRTPIAARDELQDNDDDDDDDDNDYDERDIVDEFGKIIGRAIFKKMAEVGVDCYAGMLNEVNATVQSSLPAETLNDTVQEQHTESISTAAHTRIVVTAQTYSHLFRANTAVCREIKDFYANTLISWEQKLVKISTF